MIAERTPYSIDWLLTGRGKKFAADTAQVDTLQPTGQMETFVRRICVEVINEMSAEERPPHSRIVVLKSSDLLSEKVSVEEGVLPASGS